MLPVYLLLFLLSGAGIALEVSLTRLFSYLFTHSYVYLVISISMAGLGIGSIMMRRIGEHLRKSFLGAAVFAPILLAGILLLLNRFDLAVLFSLFTAFLIFMTIGMFQVLVFQSTHHQASRLYAADLSGAAVGSVAVFLLLNAVGGLSAAILAAALISICTLLLYWLIIEPGGVARFAGHLVLLLIVTALVAISGSTANLMPKPSLMKEMTRMLEDPSDNPEITRTMWSAFGRVDMVETDNPLFKTLFIDGAAGTKMIRMEGGRVTRDTADVLRYQYMGGVPLLAVEDSGKDRALVIGSGGGIDVVTVLLAGYRTIDAVEINPDFITLVKEQSPYNGGIYTDNPQVNLIAGEGRSFVRTSADRYNLILMSLPITKSARNYGSQALTENYLFTTNAFGEYLGKLAPDGLIVIVAHYPNELLKILSNAVHALTGSGLSAPEAMRRVITFGPDNSPTLVLKQDPFTAEEIAVYRVIMETLNLRGTVTFIPTAVPQSIADSHSDASSAPGDGFHPGLAAVAQGSRSLEDLISASSEHIGVVTDDSPFFYQMSRSLPSEILTVALFAGILLVLLAAGYGIKIWLESDAAPVSRQAIMQFASFGCIGIGYMLVEIAFLQKFILYWQHQTLALAAVLGIILISSGAGSLFSGTIVRRGHFPKVMAILIGILLFWPLLVDALLLQTSAESSWEKLIVTVVVTAPPFFLMGMPFPTLLEQNFFLRRSRGEYPWMIGINSLASLAGGVFSMVIALAWGYRIVLAAGILCYAILFAILITGRNHWMKA